MLNTLFICLEIHVCMFCHYITLCEHHGHCHVFVITSRYVNIMVSHVFVYGFCWLKNFWGGPIFYPNDPVPNHTICND